VSSHATRLGARVAFAMSGDPEDPSGFSGLPASFSRALGQLAIEVVPIDVQLPEPWQRLLVNLMTFGFLEPAMTIRGLREGRDPRLVFRDHKPKLLPSREMTAIRSIVASRRLHRRDPVACAIAFGSEFRLPEGTAYVTLDDATIVSLRRSWSYPWMDAVADDALNRMIARQRQIYLKARACCLISHWATASAIDDYGVPRRRVVTVGCGPNRTLTAVGRDFAVPRFLFVGKDFERKNGPAVLRAFAEIRRLHPHATLDIVGEHPRIDQENVTGHGLLALDRAEDVQRANTLYNRATCFVMPSRFEPAGYVFAEALAAGVGAIGSNHGGSATIIGDAGVTLDPNDLPALVQQMDRFSHPAQAEAFAARARARAPLFTWRAAAERLVRALGLDGMDHDALADPL